MTTEQHAKSLGWNPKKTSLSASEYISVVGGEILPDDARDSEPFNAMQFS